MIVITVARKPLEGTVSRNALKWGCGGINIDGTRIATDPKDGPSPCLGTGWAAQDKLNAEHGFRPKAYYADQSGVAYTPSILGRWPPNMILSHMAGCQETVPVWVCVEGCPVAALDGQSGERPGMSGGGATADNANKKTGAEVIPSFNRKPSAPFIRSDTGGASRFFKQV